MWSLGSVAKNWALGRVAPNVVFGLGSSKLGLWVG